MKTLCLLRHAKSGWQNAQAGDFERELDQRGLADAPVMAQRLRAHAFFPELIVASPARRTRQTAAIFAESLGYPADRIAYDEKIYYEALDLLLGLTQSFDDQLARVMLVGHNPYLSLLAEWFSGEKFGTIPPCGLVAFSFPVASWREIGRGSGTLLFSDYP
ncbi:SixA phosphatase family protein [Desulfurivibrio sp. D14AmB]|uniref:SixA phosphatase family protein n=1 Tax=Desulfurivibrio sp. D14AmB TaxID=3374370 RepID=UPI00376EEB1C